MRKIVLIGQRTTGQTIGLAHMSKDVQAFPAHYTEDVFAEYCLDAPTYIPNGSTLVVLTQDQNHVWGLADTEVRAGVY